MPEQPGPIAPSLNETDEAQTHQNETDNAQATSDKPEDEVEEAQTAGDKVSLIFLYSPKLTLCSAKSFLPIMRRTKL